MQKKDKDNILDIVIEAVITGIVFIVIAKLFLFWLSSRGDGIGRHIGLKIRCP